MPFPITCLYYTAILFVCQLLFCLKCDFYLKYFGLNVADLFILSVSFDFLNCFCFF
nr:MAG TPA: hypothetical protein [Caudoviricetes sp.]